jgi:hypothetical protein
MGLVEHKKNDEAHHQVPDACMLTTLGADYIPLKLAKTCIYYDAYNEETMSNTTLIPIHLANNDNIVSPNAIPTHIRHGRRPPRAWS